MVCVAHSIASITPSVDVDSNVITYQDWCQTPFGWFNPGTSTTVTVDLAGLTTSTCACGGSLPADTSVIQGMYVFLSGGGTYYLDNIRTQ